MSQSSSEDDYKGVFDSVANFESKKSVFESVLSSAAVQGPPPPPPPKKPVVNPQDFFKDDTLLHPQAPAPPLRLNRNNPFAEDMEEMASSSGAIVTTPSSSTTEEGGRGTGADADGENSDDSTNLK